MLGSVITIAIFDISTPFVLLVNFSTSAYEKSNTIMISAMLIVLCDGVAILLALVRGMLLVSTKSSKNFCAVKRIETNSLNTNEKGGQSVFGDRAESLKVNLATIILSMI